MKKQKYSVHNENLLFSTGNSTQCSMWPKQEENPFMYGYMYLYMGYVYVYGTYVYVYGTYVYV